MLMLERFGPYIATLLILLGGFYYYGTLRYSQGQDNANAVCSKEVISLQSANASANAKSIAKVVDQRTSYQDALTVRNDQYTQSNYKLKQALTNIRRLQNESTDKCVNATIPINFR
jgi:hypothetical protein